MSSSTTTNTDPVLLSTPGDSDSTTGVLVSYGGNTPLTISPAIKQVSTLQKNGTIQILKSDEKNQFLANGSEIASVFNHKDSDKVEIVGGNNVSGTTPFTVTVKLTFSVPMELCEEGSGGVTKCTLRVPLRMRASSEIRRTMIEEGREMGCPHRAYIAPRAEPDCAAFESSCGRDGPAGAKSWMCKDATISETLQTSTFKILRAARRARVLVLVMPVSTVLRVPCDGFLRRGF
ncbi:hypothetical protein C8R44DRAFT_917224 [Mycena epipterygia]|nr:hypothetical protein C8R44DRAFT_917224 [Mycena epipterygia]